MRVLIADKLSASAVQELEALGCDVVQKPNLSAEELPAEIGGFHILMVRSTRVTEATIAAATDLDLIVRAGAGVNTIDLEAAGRSGVFVSNCPGRNADAVAELAMGLLVAADRRIADATIDLRAGRWRKKEYGAARGLRGRTLGILGYGTIGRNVASRARAFGMHVLVWSRSMTPETARQEGVDFAATPLELAERADAVSLHVAAAPETRQLVDAAFLQAMKPGAILINTARGDVIDTTALKRAIHEKNLRVALDVFEPEPAGGEADFPDTDLAATVTGTPHVGASTEQASEAIAAEAVRVVRRFKDTGTPANVVNVARAAGATHVLVVRHLNRVGVLAGVLDALRENQVNVDEMENIIFSGAAAASCTLRLDTGPDDATMARITTIPEVLATRLERIDE